MGRFVCKGTGGSFACGSAETNDCAGASLPHTGIEEEGEEQADAELPPSAAGADSQEVIGY